MAFSCVICKTILAAEATGERGCAVVDMVRQRGNITLDKGKFEFSPAKTEQFQFALIYKSSTCIRLSFGFDAFMPDMTKHFDRLFAPGTIVPRAIELISAAVQFLKIRVT
jgi:hypothetical protein